MELREKLAIWLRRCDLDKLDYLDTADFLIANGVTIVEQCDGNCFVCPKHCEKRKATYCG